MSLGNRHEAYYGLPSNVVFCKKCVISNQRPNSTLEFKHVRDSKKNTIKINDDGVCDACRVAENKLTIDWTKREEELLRLLDKHRSKSGEYDCLVPGSGGKDSAFQAHILKTKYGMNPLTVTWPPILYTEYGYENWKNWVDAGFDNISFNRNGKVMKLLTRLSIENMLHPFQTFILGQKNLAPKVAAQHGLSLIFYGENEAEYGNPIGDNSTSLMKSSYYSYENLNDVYLGGVSIRELRERYKLSLNDLLAYLPAEPSVLKKSAIEVHYLGYYLRWIPQEVYYYAVENTGFKPRPFRTQGTFNKYESIDDKIDDLHYYTTYIKFGIGRATYDAAHEIRNNHITREEGCALVKKFDGEFPDRYFIDIMDYIEMKPEVFHKLCEDFRSPHLWTKESGDWKLRHTVNRDGTDD